MNKKNKTFLIYSSSLLMIIGSVILFIGYNSNSKKEIPLPKLVNFPSTKLKLNVNAQQRALSYPLEINQPQIADNENFKLKSRKFNSIDYHNHEFQSLLFRFFSFTKRLTILVDTNQTYCDEIKRFEIDVLFSDELQTIPKKRRNVSHTAVFIYNKSNETQPIKMHDGALMMVQEARNPRGKWEAIEYFQQSGCGNSFHVENIRPKEKILTGIINYKGKYKTQLRVKFSDGYTTYYSNVFEGRINLGQFKRKEEFYCYYLD